MDLIPWKVNWKKSCDKWWIPSAQGKGSEAALRDFLCLAVRYAWLSDTPGYHICLSTCSVSGGTNRPAVPVCLEDLMAYLSQNNLLTATLSDLSPQQPIPEGAEKCGVTHVMIQKKWSKSILFYQQVWFLELWLQEALCIVDVMATTRHVLKYSDWHLSLRRFGISPYHSRRKMQSGTLLPVRVLELTNNEDLQVWRRKECESPSLVVKGISPLWIGEVDERRVRTGVLSIIDFLH